MTHKKPNAQIVNIISHKYSDLSGLSKTDKKDFKKSQRESFFFLQIFAIHMKNVIECWKEFFAYFNALETQGEEAGLFFKSIIFKTHSIMPKMNLDKVLAISSYL